MNMIYGKQRTTWNNNISAGKERIHKCQTSLEDKRVSKTFQVIRHVHVRGTSPFTILLGFSLEIQLA